MNRRGYRKPFLLLGLFAILILALAGAMKYTSQSQFCRNCHEMISSYETWKSSKHNSVKCMECHSDPGIVGLVQTKVKALHEVYVHVTKTYKEPITIQSDTSAFTDRCLRCHDIKGKGTAHNLIHFASNVSCADCHEGQVHDPNKNRKLPTDEVCKKCHANGSDQ
jgi:cytochrome c nitrite reductase small subunit